MLRPCPRCSGRVVTLGGEKDPRRHLCAACRVVCEMCGDRRVTTAEGQYCDLCRASIAVHAGRIGRESGGNPLEDLTGRTVGRWTVIERVPRQFGEHRTLWLCRCGCGAEHNLAAEKLTADATYQCRRCHLTEQVSKSCVVCGTTFTGTKRSRYCSMKCRASE
jgi:hypothetical protein